MAQGLNEIEFFLCGRTALGVPRTSNCCDSLTPGVREPLTLSSHMMSISLAHITDSARVLSGLLRSLVQATPPPVCAPSRGILRPPWTELPTGDPRDLPDPQGCWALPLPTPRTQAATPARQECSPSVWTRMAEAVMSVVMAK